MQKDHEMKKGRDGGVNSLWSSDNTCLGLLLWYASILYYLCSLHLHTLIQKRENSHHEFLISKIITPIQIQIPPTALLWPLFPSLSLFLSLTLFFLFFDPSSYIERHTQMELCVLYKIYFRILGYCRRRHDHKKVHEMFLFSFSFFFNFRFLFFIAGC